MAEEDTNPREQAPDAQKLPDHDIKKPKTNAVDDIGKGQVDPQAPDLGDATDNLVA